MGSAEWMEKFFMKHKLRIVLVIASPFLVYAIAWAWGSTGHRYINRNGVVHLPSPMGQFIAQQSFFESHAMDADNRKSVDTAEAPKHYIDIDYYPNFRYITRDLDSLIAQYGWVIVKQNGIVPWATIWTLDSLTAQLQRSDWNKAYLTASDLGHYVADAHQPLHCTVNYNGQLSGNSGIHSRYESTMITNYQNSLSITTDSVVYIADPINFIFEYIFVSQSYVDSVMQADTYARTTSGWNGQGTPPSSYYTYMWERTRVYTRARIQCATSVLASFWYTAWVNAGLLPLPTGIGDHSPANIVDFELLQNYPNPFNPSTTISYTLQAPGLVALTIYDVLGRQAGVLVNEKKPAGLYEVSFDASRLGSGLYFSQLCVDGFVQTKKIVFIK